MNTETHSQLANFIWSICNLLRGPYKRNEYRTALITGAVTGKIDVRGQVVDNRREPVGTT